MGRELLEVGDSRLVSGELPIRLVREGYRPDWWVVKGGTPEVIVGDGWLMLYAMNWACLGFIEGAYCCGRGGQFS